MAGMLLHIDGSKHCWFQDGQRYDLIVILDDATSGGTYVIPTFFDSMLITYPLLSGELFPYVTVVDMPKGKDIEAPAGTEFTIYIDGDRKLPRSGEEKL